jgi:hypothetical protein
MARWQSALVGSAAKGRRWLRGNPMPKLKVNANAALRCFSHGLDGIRWFTSTQFQVEAVSIGHFLALL